MRIRGNFHYDFSLHTDGVRLCAMILLSSDFNDAVNA